jgi:hypothetical protein
MKRYALLILSFALTILVTACGGGGGGGESKPESAPSPVPTTSAPASVTSALPSSASISSTPTSSDSSSLPSTPSSSELSSLSSAPASSSTSVSTSSAPIAPAGILWHDNYALDYRNGVQLAHLDGSLPAQITTRNDVSIAAWPDGKQYVVTDWNVYDDYTEITVIDRITGSTVYQEQVDYYLRDASPSPTSKNLIKVRYGEDSISPFEEFILDVSTMKIRYMISDRDWFAWMPDGRFMLINIDTGNMRIASLDSAEETPAGHLDIPADRIMGDFSVSPTGTQFIMMMNRRGTTSSEPDLWIGNIDGSDFEQLTDTKLIAGANWSPDGRYVAYITDTGSICSFGGCLGSCDQWYTPVNLRKVKGLPNTPGSEEFRISDRYGNQQILGCSVLAWTQ